MSGSADIVNAARRAARAAGLRPRPGSRIIFYKQSQMVHMAWFGKKDSGAKTGLDWDPEAEERLGRAPGFVRRMVRSKVEQAVAERGGDRVTLADYQAAEERFRAIRGGRSDEELGKLMPADNKPGTELVVLESCRSELTGCPNVLIDTAAWRKALEDWARQSDISERLRRRIAEDKVLFHHKLRLAVAGCPNGCSRPQIADVGVVGFVRPVFDLADCTECGECAAACPDQAISLEGGQPVWDGAKCQGCLGCSRACPSGCITTSPAGVRLLMGGKLGRHPHLADQVLETEDKNTVLDYLDRIVQQYLQDSDKDQRFAAWWVQHGSRTT